MRATRPPAVLVLAGNALDASDAASSLGLRHWVSPQVNPAAGLGVEHWSGIVYVDGWERAAMPAYRIAYHVAIARNGGAIVETDQRPALAYFQGELAAERAQAILANERAARRPTAVTMMAPEFLAAYVAETPLRRRWWRRLLDWLRK